MKYKNFPSISKFSRNFYVLPEFCIDFCPTVKIWGEGTCPPRQPPRPPPTPMISHIFFEYSPCVIIVVFTFEKIMSKIIFIHELVVGARQLDSALHRAPQDRRFESYQRVYSCIFRSCSWLALNKCIKFTLEISM